MVESRTLIYRFQRSTTFGCCWKRWSR